MDSHDGPPSQGQIDAFERLFTLGGVEALQRAHRSLQRRLDEHRAKLERYRREGGFTSSVEREVMNFERQVRAVEEVIRRHS